MLKILQITPSYKPAYIYGGPTTSVPRLCEELVAGSLDIEVFTTNANGDTNLQTMANVPSYVDHVKVWYFKRWIKNNSHFSPALLIELRKRLKNPHQPHLIVHIHSWWNTVAIFSCILAIWYKVPVILSPRGMLTPYTLENRNSRYKKLFHKYLGNYLLKNCIIHTTTNKERQDLYDIKLLPKKLYIIPNFISYPLKIREKYQVSFKNESSCEALQILFLSRIEEKKGLDLLFAALSQIKFKWNLTIAGGGCPNYIWKLKNLSFHLNIHPRLNWIGQLPEQEKFGIIGKHDLLVLPSQNENFANVVIESLVIGTPVVLSQTVGLADYVTRHDLGWVSRATKTDLANTLNSAFLNHQKRERIRQQAPEKILKDFSSPLLTNKYRYMYLQALKNAN